MFFRASLKLDFFGFLGLLLQFQYINSFLWFFNDDASHGECFCLNGSRKDNAARHAVVEDTCTKKFSTSRKQRSLYLNYSCTNVRRKEKEVEIYHLDLTYGVHILGWNSKYYSTIINQEISIQDFKTRFKLAHVYWDLLAI